MEDAHGVGSSYRLDPVQVKMLVHTAKPIANALERTTCSLPRTTSLDYRLDPLTAFDLVFLLNAKAHSTQIRGYLHGVNSHPVGLSGLVGDYYHWQHLRSPWISTYKDDRDHRSGRPVNG